MKRSNDGGVWRSARTSFPLVARFFCFRPQKQMLTSQNCGKQASNLIINRRCYLSDYRCYVRFLEALNSLHSCESQDTKIRVDCVFGSSTHSVRTYRHPTLKSRAKIRIDNSQQGCQSQHSKPSKENLGANGFYDRQMYAQVRDLRPIACARGALLLGGRGCWRRRCSKGHFGSRLDWSAAADHRVVAT